MQNVLKCGPEAEVLSRGAGQHRCQRVRLAFQFTLQRRTHGLTGHLDSMLACTFDTMRRFHPAPMRIACGNVAPAIPLAEVA